MAVVITAVRATGDLLDVQGTVNGVPVGAQGWVSATTGMTKAQKIAYAQALLTAAAPPAPTDLLGSFQ